MLNPNTIVEIQQLVVEKVTRGWSFTAYDITQELRARRIRGYHAQFKQVVHQLYELGQMPGYIRELKDYGGDARAWQYAYQPAGSLPGNHVLPSSVRAYHPVHRWRSSVSRRRRIIKDGKWNVPVDRRGRPCVPAAMVRTMGLKPGDTAYILTAGDHLVVSRNSHSGPPDRSYRVDRSTNLRITRSVQTTAGLNSPVLTLSMNGAGIVIGSRS